MTYDVKIFEGAEEHETIRDLRESQLLGIVSVLERHGIKYLIKDDKGTYWQHYKGYLVKVKNPHD